MFSKQLMALLLASMAQALLSQAQQVDPNFHAQPGVTAAQLCQARGYLAEEHFFATQDDHILKLTRCTNPLINGGLDGLPDRQPILFVHGLQNDGTIWLVNSFNVRPRDFSRSNLTASTLTSEPSARSLPLFAMNCGHEVWIINRRGTFGSQQKLSNLNSVGPDGSNSSAASQVPSKPFGVKPAALYSDSALLRLSFDTAFWSYSYDRQAQFDIPRAIKFVLKKSGRPKLSIVGHSAGGAIVLMSLILYPELADSLVNCVLWAPTFGLGDSPRVRELEPLEPFFHSYNGPLPHTYLVKQMQAINIQLCETDPSRRALCEQMSDQLNGDSGGLQPIHPEFYSTTMASAAAREFAQLAQTRRLGGLMHKLDYGPAGNEVAHGRSDPPAYNVSRIRLRNMSFYAGATDALVRPSDVERVLKRLTVPYKYTNITRTFNHLGYFFRDKNADLAIVPSLIDIQTLNQ